MRNLFDDFMEELRKREALARGEDPDASRPPRESHDDPDDEATEASDDTEADPSEETVTP